MQLTPYQRVNIFRHRWGGWRSTFRSTHRPDRPLHDAAPARGQHRGNLAPRLRSVYDPGRSVFRGRARRSSSADADHRRCGQYAGDRGYHSQRQSRHLDLSALRPLWRKAKKKALIVQKRTTRAILRRRVTCPWCGQVTAFVVRLTRKTSGMLYIARPVRTGVELYSIDSHALRRFGRANLAACSQASHQGRCLTGRLGDDPMFTTLSGHNPHSSLGPFDTQVAHGPAAATQPVERQNRL